MLFKDSKIKSSKLVFVLFAILLKNIFEIFAINIVETIPVKNINNA